MARNLMIIIGLSLAIAALGCPDGGETDDGGGGEGGEGGSGGTAGGGGGGTAGDGGSGGTVMDACLNESDLGMVCIPEFGDDYVTPCATDALGNGAQTSACLQEDPPGLSSDCADCFGNVTQCIASNCLGAGCAAEPDSESCLACRDEFGCDSAFGQCAGDLASACVQ